MSECRLDTYFDCTEVLKITYAVVYIHSYKEPLNWVFRPSFCKCFWLFFCLYLVVVYLFVVNLFWSFFDDLVLYFVAFCAHFVSSYFCGYFVLIFHLCGRVMHPLWSFSVSFVSFQTLCNCFVCRCGCFASLWDSFAVNLWSICASLCWSRKMQMCLKFKLSCQP